MEPRYSTSRYGHPRPRSPTFNPARASLPTSIDYNSMYSGDIHVMPTSRYSGMSSRYPYSSANPTTTTTYAVSKDPLTRGSSLRDVSRNRRSSTLDSTSARPIIVTTQNRPTGSSSHTSSSAAGRHGSPSRDDYRTSDTSFYTQPASSIRSRSHQRGGSYGGTADEDSYARSGDGLLAARDPYWSSSRPTSVYHNTSWHNPVAPVDYGGDGYEYYAPSDLARHDLTHEHAGSRSRRRESFDKPYYQRPYVNVPTDTGRSLNPPSSRYDRGGPPPSTRGFDKIGRGGSAVYDAPQLQQATIPPAVPAAPVHHAPLGSPKEHRSSGSPEMPAIAGAPARRRPVSVYQEGTSRSHHDDYYRSRDDDRRLTRDLERDYDLTRTDAFRDDSVATRGFGIRTDALASGADYDDRRDSRKESRPVPEPVKVPSDEEVKRLPAPPEEDRRRPRDSSRVRESSRVDKDRDVRNRRTSTANDDEAERKRLRDKLNEKVGTGLGIAATALGFNHLANKDDKKEDKAEKEPRRRSPEDERQPRKDDEKYRPREESREPRTRAPVIIETRRTSRDDVDRERHRRESESKSTGETSKTSPRGGSPEEDAAAKSRRRRASNAFNPTNTQDLRDLKDQLAAMKVSAPAPAPAPVPAPVAAPVTSPAAVVTPTSATAPTMVPPPIPPKEKLVSTVAPASGAAPAPAPTSAPTPATMPPEPRPSREAAVSVPSGESTLVGEGSEPRGRELTAPKSEEKQVRLVSPPRDKSDAKPLKGILKQPSKFPEEDNPIREGVAPHKDDKKLKDAPAGARWTKISRKIVNPEALTIGKERFEVRDDFVIVLRVLNKEEIQAYAVATQQLRERRRDTERDRDRDRDYDRGDRDRDYDRGRDRDRERDRDYDRDRDRERDVEGDDRSRHHRSSRRDDEYGRYDDDRDRDRDRHRRYRREDDDYNHYHSHRHRDRDREPLAIEGPAV